MVCVQRTRFINSTPHWAHKRSPHLWSAPRSRMLRRGRSVWICLRLCRNAATANSGPAHRASQQCSHTRALASPFRDGDGHRVGTRSRCSCRRATNNVYVDVCTSLMTRARMRQDRNNTKMGNCQSVLHMLMRNLLVRTWEDVSGSAVVARGRTCQVLCPCTRLLARNLRISFRAFLPAF